MLALYPTQESLSGEYISRFNLNVDQAEALHRVAAMFSLEKTDSVDSSLLIHGRYFFFMKLKLF